MSVAPATRQRVDSDSPTSIASLLKSLTRDEKASLLAGVDDWHLRGFPELDIPSIRVTDCGHGVTLCGPDASPATCFPTGIGMASTWNTDLIEAAGRILGRETRALGCSILLGPKINLHRHPLNGRSFETFSEDPWLAGSLGAAVIRGIQSEGVGSCVKAVVANNQQRDQEKVSSNVDETTLREIYLRAFQIAVELGHPSAIMTAYNRLNGEFSSECEWLIKRVIKGEWKFPGFIVSDWRAVHSSHVYESGLDLEMPGPGKFLNQKAVLDAMDEGLLTEDELDDKAGRILGAILTYGKASTSHAQNAMLDSPQSRATALAVAEESIVLLKNQNNILPLDIHQTRKILVVGPNAAQARLGGGGSASVTPFYAISPLDGIREICGSNAEITYLEGCSLVGSMEPIHGYFTHANGNSNDQPGLKAEFFNGLDPLGRIVASWSVEQIDFSWGWASPGAGVQREHFAVSFSGWLTPPVSGTYKLGIYAQEGCINLLLDGEPALAAWDNAKNGNFEEKYQTRYFTIERELQAETPVAIRIEYGKRAARAGVRLEWEIPGTSNSSEKLITAAREADAVIVCAGLSNLFEGGAHDRENIDLSPAQQKLIENISQANPRTIVTLFNGGPLAMPWEPLVPAILEAWYPGQEGGRALARILFGQTNPSGRLPDTLAYKLEDHRSIGHYPGNGVSVTYGEGMFIGYRHFDTASIKPHFPFGFGLGYTSFHISEPSLTEDHILADGETTVLVTVRNTGPRRGKEVVQLYISRDDRPTTHPGAQLRGFHKIDLAPGEEMQIAFSIGTRELEHFDAGLRSWVVAPGSYQILAGAHSRSLKTTTLHVQP